MNKQHLTSDRSAAIAVIVRESKLLVIERSQTVRAPGKFCFPGGQIESGEHMAEALVRELSEELNLAVKAVRPLWASVARSGCRLNWIHARLVNAHDVPNPNTDEVASWHWMTPIDLAGHREVLPSNLEFIQACQTGQIVLPHY